MNNHNLQPITSTEKAREIGRKGGLQSTQKKKIAATLREWQKRLQKNPNLNEPERKIVLELMDNGDAARFQLFQFYAKLLLNAKTDNAQTVVLRDLMTLVEHQHGKAAIKNENFNINVDAFQVDYAYFRDAVKNVLQPGHQELLRAIALEYDRLRQRGGSV